MQFRPFHRWSLLLLAALVTSSACQKAAPEKSPAPAATPTAPAGLPSAATAADAPALAEPDLARMADRTLPSIQDHVPSALTHALTFVPRVDEKKRVAVAVPSTWVQLGQPGTYGPPPGAQLGTGTMMAFGSGCDGRCAPKDWPAAFDKVEVKAMTMQKIESDEPIGTSGRIVVGQVGGMKQIVAGVWKPEASRYFWCRATLDGPAVEALSAFVVACRGLEIGRWE